MNKQYNKNPVCNEFKIKTTQGYFFINTIKIIIGYILLNNHLTN